jgi:hypothetical protein
MGGSFASALANEPCSVLSRMSIFHHHMDFHTYSRMCSCDSFASRAFARTGLPFVNQFMGIVAIMNKHNLANGVLRLFGQNAALMDAMEDLYELIKIVSSDRDRLTSTLSKFRGTYSHKTMMARTLTTLIDVNTQNK